MKLAMLRVDRLLREEKFRAEILLTVHDELVLEVDEGDAERLTPLLAQAMQDVVTLEVPLVVDVGRGTTWADAH